MSVNARLLIGQVITRNQYKPHHVKVRCNRMKLDKRLLMYFPKRYDKWVMHDPTTKVDIGDIVLIQDQTEKISPLANFKIHETVFKVGDVWDPIACCKVRGTEYIDETARNREIGMRTPVVEEE